MERTIRIFKGKSFSSFEGFYDSIIVTVDSVETFAWTSEVDAQRYVIGLRDAFLISGSKVKIVNEIAVKL